MVLIRGVEVVHWNPRLRIGVERLAPRGWPLPVRTNNFGDMLGPAVVERLAPPDVAEAPVGPQRLLAVGSILQFARDGDVVWGSGINGKLTADDSLTARRLDVRAVRGPLTAAALQRRGIPAPDVYGDPGLLAPALLGIPRHEPTIPVTSVPNLRELHAWRGRPGLLNPRSPYATVIETIARSALVVASSLHAIVIADALGVPVSPVRPQHEALFKYEDYYEGTGRRLPAMAPSFGQALATAAPPLEWSDTALLSAFPADLWAVDRWAVEREPDPVEN